MAISDKSVWLNSSRTKVVEAGSEEAAFLLVAAGGEVSEADAEKYGLTTREATETDSRDNTVRQVEGQPVPSTADIDGDGTDEGGPEGAKKAMSAPRTATKTATKSTKKARK